MVRCNRCGNENPPEPFVCAFCGAKLKIEKIERIKFFERPEKKWKRPQRVLTRYVQVFIKPSELFWDLRYDEKRRGAIYILLMNGALVGLIGMVLLGRVNFPHDTLADSMIYLSTFLSFFLFGLLYHLLLFGVLSYLYKIVGSRQGGRRSRHSFIAMLYAFFPSVVGNAINILVLLIALPTASFSGFNVYGDLARLFQDPQAQLAWQITGIISFIIYGGWIPLLAGLCVRSLHDSSTFRSIVWSYIVGIIMGILVFLTSGIFIESAVP